MISIHAPLAGCDAARPARCTRLRAFQSTHPLRGATLIPSNSAAFFCISIHAPLAGCDSSYLAVSLWMADFNPRTPCGVRPCPRYPARQPTPGDFNPRTPCGVRRAACSLDNYKFKFQSTHPLRGATLFSFRAISQSIFQSTHPLRGATPSLLYGMRKAMYFNPRTPCGVRLLRLLANSILNKFQSTHPLRGATRLNSICRYAGRLISIHAPLAGCDSKNVQRKLHFF